MKTGDGWNQTLTEFTYDGQTIVQQYDYVSVMFELGYPYIGLSEKFYDLISDALSSNVRDMDCAKGEHWGLCRVENKTCEKINLYQNLTFTMNDVRFDIPLANIAVDVKQQDTTYCQMQIGLLRGSDNSVVLGSAFFTAFVGIFDV